MIDAGAAVGETLTVRRSFAAPVERVYRAWTDPARLAAWFRPNERWLPSTAALDVREGGEMRIEMRHSDGDVVVVSGRYTEVAENVRLAFTCRFGTDPTKDEETDVVLDFVPGDGGTLLTLTQKRIGSVEGSKNYESGWSGCLDTLDAFLLSDE